VTARVAARALFVRIILGLTLSVIAGIAFAQSAPGVGPASIVQPDLKRLIDEGVLRVALPAFDLPSFVTVDKQGELTGYEVLMIRRLARELGLRVEFVREARTFDEIVKHVAEGRAHIGVGKLQRTLSRAMLVNFSDPYLVLRHAILYNRAALVKETGDRELVDVLRNLKGPIGVIKGSAWVENAKRNFPGARVIEYASWEPDIIRAVLQGQVVAAYRDEFETKKYIKDHPQDVIPLGSAVLTDVMAQISIVVDPKLPGLLRWINIFIEVSSVRTSVDALLGLKGR
jgi:polar amino acid transport system substrate-binding protein